MGFIKIGDAMPIRVLNADEIKAEQEKSKNSDKKEKEETENSKK